MMETKCCATCKWYDFENEDDETSICWNTGSVFLSEEMEEDEVCDQWESQ